MLRCISRSVAARGSHHAAGSVRFARHAGPAWRRGAWMATDARSLTQHTEELHQETLRPINDRLLGPLQKEATQFPAMPVVFLLGNHSSGKSSFINFVLGEQVQKAGVAPTDDGFTIIAPGQQRLDQDGPALVGDPDLGFAGLRGFGTPLINHLHLKVRPGLDINDVMLIDSPGMIDSPSPQGGGGMHGWGAGDQSTDRDRGYDFQGVTRWFAERADVILLFFDPDKPGTTGETLTTLTTALAGLDYKLHIILNKVDQFGRIHDFARAYGSLCWNLSKVIPRKDLPRIYTMCLPIVQSDGTSHDPAEEHMLGPGMADLAQTRNEVVHEVLKAPERRLDNMVTCLYDSTRLLMMHARVVDAVRADHRSMEARKWGMSGAVMLLGQSLAALGFSMGAPMDVAAAISGVTLAGAAGTHAALAKSSAATIKHLLSEDGLTDVFRRVYFKELAERDEFVWSLWQRVLPQLQVALQTFGLSNLQRVKSSEMARLTRIVEEEVPTLRRSAAELLAAEQEVEEHKLEASWPTTREGQV